MQRNKRVILKYKNCIFFVMLDNNLFFCQPILMSHNKFFTDYSYTYMYVLKILSRFGLTPNLIVQKKLNLLKNL